MKSFIKRCLRKLLSKLKKQLLKIKKLFANTIFTTQKVACKIWEVTCKSQNATSQVAVQN